MLRYLVSIPILAAIIIGVSSLWFFGVLNQAKPSSFSFTFSRSCSGYEQHPKLIVSVYDDKAPKFRFMLHEVDEGGNRVTSEETCSRLSLHFPKGTHRLSHISAEPNGKLIESPVGNYGDQEITLVSGSDASNVRCERPVICLNSGNVIGIEGSLPERPAWISFAGRAAYFYVVEQSTQSFPRKKIEKVVAQVPLSERDPWRASDRKTTIFEIGLGQAYELTAQTTPQPTALAFLYGDGLDSWYRFEPQPWPYVTTNLANVLVAYQSRWMLAVRDSLVFLLAAILGVAVQAAVDLIRKKVKTAPRGRPPK